MIIEARNQFGSCIFKELTTLLPVGSLYLTMVICHSRWKSHLSPSISKYRATEQSMHPMFDAYCALYLEESFCSLLQACMTKSEENHILHLPQNIEHLNSRHYLLCWRAYVIYIYQTETYTIQHKTIRWILWLIGTSLLRTQCCPQILKLDGDVTSLIYYQRW